MSIRFLNALLIVSACVIGGCASSSKTADAESEGIIHRSTDADLAAVKSTEPLTADRATLYVNGLGCPLCATNVDQQLKKMAGVQNVSVDLGNGTVNFDLIGPLKPSPAKLAHAIEDAGFTLVKVEAR